MQFYYKNVIQNPFLIILIAHMYHLFRLVFQICIYYIFCIVLVISLVNSSSGLEQSANGTSGSNFDARGLSKGPENLFVYS